MAKSYVPLSALAGTLVLALGCGGTDSVASESARAFREAQRRGEKVQGDAHGHGAVSPTSGEAEAGDHAGHATASVTAVGKQDEHAAMDRAMEHGDGGGRAAPGGHDIDHAARGHGRMAHGGTGTAGKPIDHAAMGHGGGTAAPTARATAPADHAAMGHGTAHAAQPPSLAAIEARTATPPAAPVTPGAPAATLSPDPLDAPAPTAVAQAQRAATASGASGGHGAHGPTSTYRHVDAGRGLDAHDASRDDEPVSVPSSGHSGHEPTPSPTPPSPSDPGGETLERRNG